MPRPGSDRARADDVRLAPRAGRDVPRSGGGGRLVGRRRGPVRGVPRAVPRAAGPRPVAGPDRPVLLNNWEAHVLRLRRRPARRDRARTPRPGRRAVRPRRRLVRASATPTTRRSATGWSTGASCRRAGRPGPAGDRLGLTFGLWIEPEMVNPTATCFRAHPEWAIGVPGRARKRGAGSAGSRPRAARRSWTTSSTPIGEVLGSAPISYVKWDWNRPITEPCTPAGPADRQGEWPPPRGRWGLRPVPPAHRALPGILFESCQRVAGPGLTAGLARVGPAGLDERRHGRCRAAGRSRGLARPIRSRHGCARLARAETTRRPVSPIGSAPRGDVRRPCSATSWTPTVLSDEEQAEVRARWLHLERRANCSARAVPTPGARWRATARDAAWMVLRRTEGEEAIVGVFGHPQPPDPGVACASRAARARPGGDVPPVDVARPSPGDPPLAPAAGPRTGAEPARPPDSSSIVSATTRRPLGNLWARLIVLERTGLTRPAETEREEDAPPQPLVEPRLRPFGIRRCRTMLDLQRRRRNNHGPLSEQVRVGEELALQGALAGRT